MTVMGKTGDAVEVGRVETRGCRSALGRPGGQRTREEREDANGGDQLIGRAGAALKMQMALWQRVALQQASPHNNAMAT